MPTKTSLAVAAEVRRLMADTNTSEAALAEAATIPRVTLRRRLAGAPFTTDELFAVADVLGTTAANLIAPAQVVAA